ncbi:MAG: SpoIIE family protein phosphatase [Deltaproteobacteria bacterium]|nr:SpoIIE family protein phosphatase [Deltaproteobacteria bacterium]
MRTPPLILIVDDNPANVEIFEMRLAANNYEIITASDGEAGLAIAKDHLPDLILLDIMMPKMDGVEVCRHLRADSSLPFMPIIIVTAKTDSKDVVAGLEAGADEYLTKPVNHAALVARVKSMLRIKLLHDTVIEQSSQLKGQLKTATKVQSLFWPDIPDLAGDSHLWAAAIPAAYVSGDLYDVIPLPDGSLLAYVADVSDKGVPAALVMAALSTKIRSEARNQYEIDALLQTVNNSTYNLTSEEGFFATIVLTRYWPQSGKMQLAMGGHLQPLWISDTDIRNIPQIKGISLGVTQDAHYEKREISLAPGESILLFTDGVIEAENEDNELFGNQRLVEFIKDAKSPPRGDGLIEFISNWRGNSSASDDLTILEIWRDEN